MKKSICNKKCIYCKSDNVKYNGYAKGGRHRYHCNSCHKNFVDNPKFKQTKITEQVINILYSLLKNDFYNERKLAKSIEKAKKDKVSEEIKYISKQVVDTLSGSYIDNCNNPKVIICTDYNKLVFYKISKQRSQKNCKIFIE